MRKESWLTLVSAVALSIGNTSAQTIERVKPGDATLDCPGIQQEARPLDGIIAAGDPNNGAVGRAAAGAGAGVAGQVGGSLIGSIFGPLGSVIGGAAGNASARTATEQKMAPDAAAKQRGTDAASRKDFLSKLAAAKGCKADDASVAGRALTAEEFDQIAGAPAPGGLTKVTPFSVASVTPALAEAVSPGATSGLFDGKLDLKGKRFYIAEFRVLYDVGGEVTASTRAGYLPGRDYGATRMRVTYNVPNVDIAAFQAITDKVYSDFTARLQSAGVKLEEAEAFVKDNGFVYEATETPSKPGAPVLLEKNGRKYLVTAPAGMKLVSRGFAGMGTGNMTKRMDYVRGNLEALSVSVAVNVAALESSGNNRSSITTRGSSADAKEGMSITQAPDGFFVHTHANGSALRMVKALPLDGNYASFREAGGYDSSKDAVARTAGIISNMGGLAANNSKRVDMEVDLDGPATTRLAMRGLVTINQGIVDQIKAGM